MSADPLDSIAKKISAAAKDLQNKKVAVLPFPFHDGRESAGSTIVSERLTTKLVGLKKLEVIERSLLEKIFKELKLQSSGAVDEQSAKQIGKVLGVDAIVSGTLIDLGGKDVEVNARLIQLETGKILAAASSEMERCWDENESRAKTAKPAETTGVVATQDINANERKAAEPPMSIGNSADMPPQDPTARWQSEDILSAADLPERLAQNPLGQNIRNGFELLKDKRGADAEKQFRPLLGRTRNKPKVNAVVRLGLSISLFEQGEKDQAFRLAGQIAGQNKFPKVKSMADFVLGRFSEISGKPREAVKYYVESIKSAPFQTKLTDAAGRRLQALKEFHR